MKKRKILVPALGLLALSTVATVTGTVAWFTANAKVNVKFSNFAIEKLTSDLLVTSTAGVGTQVKSDGAIYPTSVGTSGYAKLTQASVNSTTGDTWSKDSINATTQISGKTTYLFDDYTADQSSKFVAKTDASGTATTYYSMSWDSTFSRTVTGSEKIGLYFDTRSKITPATSAASGNVRTFLGFRLGMYVMNADNTAVTKYVVWSPEQAYSPMTWNNGAEPTDPTLQGKTSCYVATKTTVTNYVDGKEGNLIYKGDTSVGYLEVDEHGEFARKDCLAEFTSSTPNVHVRFIAWYEGEDVNVIDDSVLDDISATLSFYVRINDNAE